jgi:4-hydroxybenzoate polyprenyltransferase
MKDVMDFQGDKKSGVKSFPKYIGIRKSNILSAFFFIIAIILSFFPFTMSKYEVYFHNYYYFFIVIITDIMLLSTSIQLVLKKNPHMKLYRKLTLTAIFIGLLAFLIGVFIH